MYIPHNIVMAIHRDREHEIQTVRRARFYARIARKRDRAEKRGKVIGLSFARPDRAANGDHKDRRVA